MCIWWILLSVVFLISHTSGVHSQNVCHDDQQCHALKCCLGHCTSRTFCPCRRNADCPSGETCFLRSLRCRPIAAQSSKSTTTHSSTPNITSAPYTQSIDCARDSECEGSLVCKDGQCVDHHRSGKNAWIRGELIMIGGVVALLLIIGCLSFLCKKATSLLALARMRIEAALTTTRVTSHETQPGNPSVIFMDEHSPSLGAPPPYSSLEFGREIDEPPSYDDAVRISAMPAVVVQ